MNFIYAKYLPLIFILIIVFSFVMYKNVNKYFQWITDHWFYKPKKRLLLSQYLYILGFSLLVFGLLDIRGPEENIEAKTSDMKTVILIDVSASMLAEDVRPNRIGKAIMLAKHYVKKAIGQQVSVIVFSENASKLVPFTKDRNLLEARIDGIKTIDMNRGGTGLKLAISESIQYFKIDSKEVPIGNILIFTDAEDHETDFNLEIPETISLAIVGLGTAKGSTIPLRGSRGENLGLKKHAGEVVTSKLDENAIKKLGENAKRFQYWVANTYSIPTTKIINFFQSSHFAKLQDSITRVKPVWANKLLIPAMIIILFSFLFRCGRVFALPMAMFLLFPAISYSQKDMPEKEVKKTKEIIQLENKLKQGELDVDGRLYLAEKLLKVGAAKESAQLYEETLQNKEINDKNQVHQFNKGTAELEAGKIREGLDTNVEMLKYLEDRKGDDNQKLRKMVGQNILKALEVQAQNQSKESEKSEGEGDSSDSKDQKGEGKESKNQKKNKDKDDQDQDENKDKDKKKDGQDDQKENEKEKDGDKDKKKDKNKGDGQKKTVDKEKLPTLLKQLLSDDNKLQKKMLEMGTKKKKRNQKDW